MKKWLKRRFALSDQGAADTIKGSLASALQNIALMLPVALLYLLIKDLMEDTVQAHKTVYIIGSVICCVLILLTTRMQYNGTFLATYVETGVRRIALAEKLRKLPLSFFGKKDLADLTASIMNDCTILEQSQSHFVSPLIGSMISTALIAVSLLFFNWQMALAALWVLPVSFAVVLLSSGVQKRVSVRAAEAKIICEDGIQECIEAMNDLRSNNAEAEYLKGLTQKIRNVERHAVMTEFGTATFVTFANLILKLGIATTVLTGSALLMQNKTDLLTFFMFMIVVSRLYDPLEGALQNLAAIISTNTNITRMNEILDHPIQTGTDTLTNQGCDICFDHVGFAYENGETVLRDVSFTAKQGAVTALVSPSGGGKTTVSRLAARFWDINKGRITVGGMDISQVDPEALMSLYSIVFQDVTMFNNSIMENIRIGKPDATDEEVIAAANGSAFRSRAPSSRMHPSSCWMKPPPRWTLRTKR